MIQRCFFFCSSQNKMPNLRSHPKIVANGASKIPNQNRFIGDLAMHRQLLKLCLSSRVTLMPFRAVQVLKNPAAWCNFWWPVFLCSY